jgi:hypothetical protein
VDDLNRGVFVRPQQSEAADLHDTTRLGTIIPLGQRTERVGRCT